ncbi:hypothetical protein HF313_08795 [Massilia atriviolacea]|uniref:DUF4760 domain-containing protein n=1 Tax=Massilia atriviolacea TaxID=2495579 RepID=A0A430HDK8_9BURK|nr:hypothetical protein [Massilia atriviolacea]RSZ55594.1 hypothetical protein EJB06_29000 [Massilia atriviolacea]
MTEPTSTLSLSDVKDIVVALAAIVGMIVAILGLTTWRRQLKGGIEYELTRRLLKYTYRLREALKVVRHPAMFGSELAAPESEKRLTEEQRRYAGLSSAYRARWEKVVGARDDLQRELLEAEVVWNKEIYARFKPLFALQEELNADVYSYLALCNPDESVQARNSWQEIRRGRPREVLYDSLGEKPDEFSSDVVHAIVEIESYLKPHLKK